MTVEGKLDSGMDRVAECSVPWYRSCRYWLAAVCFLGGIHVYSHRVGISVGIVCMVNQTAIQIQDKVDVVAQNGSDIIHSNDSSCSLTSFGSGQAYEDGPFIWDKRLQGHVLGAFFYGYLVSQVPSGMLAERYGGKWVWAFCISLSTMSTLLVPMAARTSVILLAVLRVVAGIGSGVACPAILALWSQWAPPHERSKLTNISVAGFWMGNVITMPLAGFLCKHGFDGGWPSIFYVTGISSVLMILLWICVVHDNPSKHPRISAAERDYIVKSLGLTHSQNRKTSVPWLSILTSPPVWSVIVAAICVDWGLYLFLTQTPTYMYEVLKFDVQSNGLLSALPFLAFWLFSMCISVFADKLIASKLLSVGKVRKLFHGIGGVGSACCIIILSYADCGHPALAVVCLTLGVGLIGSHYSGFILTPIDIAPQYAATIFGLANGISSACGFLAPYVVAVLTPNRSHAEWQMVFFLTAAINISGAVFYIIFSRGEIQDWAKENTIDEAEVDVKLMSNGKATITVNGDKSDTTTA